MDKPASRQIVAALDGTDADRAITMLAATIARQSAAELVLVRVVRPTLPPFFPPEQSKPERVDVDTCSIERTDCAILAAHRQLCELEEKIRDVHVATLVLVSARPAKRINEWLRSRPVALVLVAAPGAGACRRRSNLATYLSRLGAAPILKVACSETRAAPHRRAAVHKCVPPPASQRRD